MMEHFLDKKVKPKVKGRQTKQHLIKTQAHIRKCVCTSKGVWCYQRTNLLEGFFSIKEDRCHDLIYLAYNLELLLFLLQLQHEWLF